MEKLICEKCGALSEKNETLSRSGLIIWNVIKTVVFLIIFIGLWFIPVVGWILAIALLFVPINQKNKNKCTKCQNENCIIPVDSPKGQELYKKYYNER